MMAVYKNTSSNGPETKDVTATKTESLDVDISTSSSIETGPFPEQPCYSGDFEQELGSTSPSSLPSSMSGRRRCYIYLTIIIFTAGVSLVAFSATMFHQRSKQQSMISSGNNNKINTQDPSIEDGNTTSVNVQRTGAPTTAEVTTGLSTFFPSSAPSIVPTSVLDFYLANTAVFYAIGDVPYDSKQVKQLEMQMRNIPQYTTADFLIHVGDLRNASESDNCLLEEFQTASQLLQLSPIPVFVVLGDNDWNDCPNAEEGLSFWRQEFMHFETRYWNHTFNITRQPYRDENFVFQLKGTLFVGINLVGGKLLDEVEWTLRLVSQADWVMGLIRKYRDEMLPKTGRVVLFGHAEPTKNHDIFFDPLRDFIRDELGDSIPLLYLHGDKHKWEYESSYLSQSNVLRIMVNGGTEDPPVKVTVNANGYLRPTNESFIFDRDLDNKYLWNSAPTT